MKITGRKKAAALLIAAVLAVTGCDNGNDEHGDSWAPPVISREARAIADEYYAGSKDSFPVWAAVDKNKVICSVNDPEHIPFFDITYGTFIDEYMYYLIANGIEDDTTEDTASYCKAYRANLINVLTFEKLFLYAAENDYGISEATLSDEQLSEIRSTADGVRSDWEMSFYDAVSARLGEDAAAARVRIRSRRRVRRCLTRCWRNAASATTFSTHGSSTRRSRSWFLPRYSRTLR